jgi:hypothetical protein
LTLDPFSDKYSLNWEEQGVIGLDVPNRPAFVTLGQFCPVVAKSYRLVFDAAFDPMPTDTWQHLSIAFGHADDRYYEHRSATPTATTRSCAPTVGWRSTPTSRAIRTASR